MKLNPEFQWQSNIQQEEDSFHHENGLKFVKNKLAKCYIWSAVCVVPKLGHFGKYIRNNWKVLKCGAGEGWRRSVGPIM
jgi:hypothetical protein